MPAPKPTGHLSDVDKGIIIALKEEGCSWAAIATRTGRNKSTVRSFWKRYQKRGHEKNFSSPGRPITIDDRTRRRVIFHALAHRRLPLRELRNTVAPETSIRTIKRILREADIRKWRAKKRAMLTPAHVASRLAWALKYKDWTEEEWEGVIFSDECSVEKSKAGQTDWVYARPNERYHKDCIQGVTKGPGIKLMVWSCIWGGNKGPLIPIFAQSVDRWAYIDVLKRGLIDVYYEVHDTIGDPLFQQDNARIHTANATKEWFEENNISVMDDWPPNSPDMNPIEHCWKRLKEKLHARYPDIINTVGPRETVKKTLADALEVCWKEEIEGEFLQKLWKSMPRRVAALVEAKGWYTKY